MEAEVMLESKDIGEQGLHQVRGGVHSTAVSISNDATEDEKWGPSAQHTNPAKGKQYSDRRELHRTFTENNRVSKSESG